MGKGRVAGLALCLLGGLAGAGCSERRDTVGAGGTPYLTGGPIDFGLVGLRQRVASRTELRNGGRSPVRIVAARFEGAGAEDYRVWLPSEALVVAGQGLPLPVEFRPAIEGARPAELVLETDSADSPEIRVPVSGQGLLAKAELGSRFLDFGAIEVASSRALGVALTNSSPLPARVSWRMLGPQASEYDAGAPLLLEPGASLPLDVVYRPRQVGKARADLWVVPCDGCDGELVQLTGLGLDSALQFEPPALDFGGLNVDRFAVLPIGLRNVSDLPVQVTGLALGGATDPSFRLLGSGGSVILAPGQALQSSVEFVPSHLGTAVGTLEARSTSVHRPVVQAPLEAIGGGPEIGVSPVAIEFGPRTVGSRTGKKVRIQNNGGSLLDLEITAIRVMGTSRFAWGGLALPARLKAGDFVDLDVFFEPDAQGQYGGSLVIESNDASTPAVSVALSGQGQQAQPCQVEVTPSRIDFGSFPPNRGAVQGFKVVNVGPDICAVKNLAVDDGGANVFRLSGIVPPGIELDPGEFFVRHLSFTGAPSGDFVGTLSFEVANPAAPRVTIPLSARVARGCLSLKPVFLDWGRVRGDCAVPTMSFEVVNGCGAPAVVNGAWVGEGTDPEFELRAPPSFPAAIPAGGRLRLEVAYLAQVLGKAIAPLYVGAADLQRPLMLPLLGENWPGGHVTDTFFQQAPGALDVLFVVDNSESMVEEQPRLAQAIPSFVAAARSAGVDLRAAVTTTGLSAIPGGSCPGGAFGGEAGRFFPADGSARRILTLAVPGVEQTLAFNTQVGFCHFIEEPFEAMRRALTSPLVDSFDDPRTPLPADGNRGFLRSEASLAVVFVSDEDDHSGQDASAYADFLKDLKGRMQPERLSVLAVGPTAQACSTAGGFPGTRYAQLAASVGGRVEDVCEPDYGPALRSVAQVRAAPAQTTFPLSATPDSAGLTVAVDGAPASGWSYDAGANAVRFSSPPRAGARITVDYEGQCR